MLTTALAAPFVVGAVAQANAEPVGGVGESRVEFRFTDRLVAESSGLVATDVDGERLFATVNDSGDSGRVFTVDPTTGDTVGVTRFTPDPRDVEALAPAGDGHVWVGDIGDNLAARDHVRVTKVPLGRGDIDAGTGESYRLAYPDGARDAESLIAHPVTGRLYVVSKKVFGGSVYAAPETLDPDGVNVMEKIGSAPMIVTDAAFSPSGEYVLMRGYSHLWVKTFPGLETVADLTLPRQPQGEGLAVDDEGRVYVCTEGLDTPVLRVGLPVGVENEIAGGSFFWKLHWRALPR